MKEILENPSNSVSKKVFGDDRNMLIIRKKKNLLENRFFRFVYFTFPTWLWKDLQEMHPKEILMIMIMNKKDYFPNKSTFLCL